MYTFDEWTVILFLLYNKNYIKSLIEICTYVIESSVVAIYLQSKFLYECVKNFATDMSMAQRFYCSISLGIKWTELYSFQSYVFVVSLVLGYSTCMRTRMNGITLAVICSL